MNSNVIIDKIYTIRGMKVMLDSDLSELYNVPTKRINEQVKRNSDRFPEDFMFRLTDEEWFNLKSQYATSSWGGRRNLPFAFTEHGILMLSSVLNSEKAIAVNIHIVRVYTKLRNMHVAHQKILDELNAIKQKVGSNSSDIDLIFNYLKQLEQNSQNNSTNQNRKRIGYKK